MKTAFLTTPAAATTLASTSSTFVSACPSSSPSSSTKSISPSSWRQPRNFPTSMTATDPQASPSDSMVNSKNTIPNPQSSIQQQQPPPPQHSHATPLLDRITYPEDLRRLHLSELRQLAHELRSETLSIVSRTGGHLGASLGVVELTIALHYVFHTPNDKLIWDVAHQTYPHKILTGRRSQMLSLRKSGGLSGFTRREESEYDAFGAGHSSTSISAALGMAVARDHAGRKNQAIAVIGDGAITGGMAYEAMNNAGCLRNRVIVVFNDNGQVSLPTGTKTAAGQRPAGALHDYTSQLLSSKPFQDVRSLAKNFSKLFPQEIQGVAAQVDEFTRSVVSAGGTLFEELGFYYIGPIDGHRLETLVPVLENVRDMGGNKPVLVHVKTEKGYGYKPAMNAFDKYHGVAKFDIKSGKQFKAKNKTASYTSIFAKSLIEHAQVDRKILAITAAMPGGTGLNIFGDRFPDRCYDVGIAEQHAVTMAAGMATEGYKPFACIYSTFLQRGYDQLIHDVALQNLPVRFILDRAGLVGNDGPTHHGSFDLAYMGCVPNMVIMAPSDELELQHMVATAVGIDVGPSAVRYPRGSGIGVDVIRDKFGGNVEDMPTKGHALPIGRGRYIKKKAGAASRKGSVAILSLGTRLLDSVLAAEALETRDVAVTVADARFMKPLDRDLIRQLVQEHEIVVTIEEGSIGGFGDHVLHWVVTEGLLDDGNVRFRPMVLPDRFIEHGSQSEQIKEAGLGAEHIEATALKLLGRSAEVLNTTNVR